MLKRTITGAVILIITIGVIVLRQFSALIFDVFALIICYGCLYEVIKATKQIGKKPSEIALYTTPLLIFIAWVLDNNFNHSWAYVLAVALIVLMFSLTEDIVELYQKRKVEEIKNEEQTTSKVAKTVSKSEEVLQVVQTNQNKSKELFEHTKSTMMIFAYPILPLMTLIALNNLDYNFGYMGIILSFAVAMCTDTFAFLFGSSFGKRKFVPEISPNKTVAGLIGGFVGGIIASALCFIVFYFGNLFGLKNIPLDYSISVFVLIGIFGAYICQLGDLVASALKRRTGIKDFAHIFPGHGGFMDRVDGQMFVTCLIYVIFVLLLV